MDRRMSAGCNIENVDENCRYFRRFAFCKGKDNFIL